MSRDWIRMGVALALALPFVQACSLELEGSAPASRDEPNTGTGMGEDGTDAPVDDLDAGMPITDASAPEDASAAPPDAGLVRPDAAVPEPLTPLCSDDPSLVACYPFAGDANDHGPRGNHLEAKNVRWEPGGGVLLSADSELECNAEETLAHGKTSVELRVRVDQMPTAGRSALVDHDGQYGIFLHPGGELRCSMVIAAASVASAPSVVQQGTWHHVACVAEGAASILYVDGVMVASAPGTTQRTPAASGLNVGENSPDRNDQLIGAIRDLRILEAELTAAQVAADAARK